MITKLSANRWLVVGPGVQKLASTQKEAERLHEKLTPAPKKRKVDNA